jgi:hypothetical protein
MDVSSFLFRYEVPTYAMTSAPGNGGDCNGGHLRLIRFHHSASRVDCWDIKHLLSQSTSSLCEGKATPLSSRIAAPPNGAQHIASKRVTVQVIY